MADQDAALFKDIERAGPELERRLLASVSVQDGLVLVHDPIMGKVVSYVLPTSSPWVISCGIGLSVIFGSAVSGDGSSIGNEVEIHLSLDFIEQDKCAVLAPRLGRRLKALLQERGNSP